MPATDWILVTGTKEIKNYQTLKKMFQYNKKENLIIKITDFPPRSHSHQEVLSCKNLFSNGIIRENILTRQISIYVLEINPCLHFLFFLNNV